MKSKKIAMLFVILQGIFTLVSLIVAIIYFFNPKVKIFLPFFLGITLLILSFNNYKIYHKKSLTVVYLVFGLLCILFGIVKLG